MAGVQHAQALASQFGDRAGRSVAVPPTCDAASPHQRRELAGKLHDTAACLSCSTRAATASSVMPRDVVGWTSSHVSWGTVGRAGTGRRGLSGGTSLLRRAWGPVLPGAVRLSPSQRCTLRVPPEETLLLQLAPQIKAVLATFGQTPFQVGQVGIEDAGTRTTQDPCRKSLGTRILTDSPKRQTRST